MIPDLSATDLNDVHVTILAGGSGTRLWPLSRQRNPKQLLPLLGERSTLQETVARVRPLVPPERVYILTGVEQAEAIAAQLPEIPPDNIHVEPCPRGTAACLGLAAMRLGRHCSDDAVMISLHADHTIREQERFRSALVAAVVAARQGYLVTIGIVPSRPDTGFGYIERGEALAHAADHDIYHMLGFTEKPPVEQASAFVHSGRFYWNTGYFCWTLGQILGEFARQLPEMHSQLAQIVKEQVAGRPWRSIWERIAPKTIDVGIMEHAARAAVIPSDLGWSDIGSWAALYDILPHDAHGNVWLGDGQHLGIDTVNSLVYSGGRLVATIGLNDVVVVDAGDAVLVLPKGRAQDVGALVKELRRRGMERFT